MFRYFGKNKIKEILLHLLFWVGIWFFFVYFFNYNANNREYIIWFSSFLLPVTAFATYVMIYRLIPNYLLFRKYWKFALHSFYVLVFSAYMVVLAIYASLILVLKSDIQSIPPMVKNFVSVMILVYLIVGLVSLVYILNYNFKTVSKNKELRNKILSTQLQLKEQELNYLKMQIHPHFLFNTLNTIYGFSLKQSKHTPELILKLSNLLDYILYKINKPAVSLQEEVDHIREYVELEKIRFEESLRLNFNAGQLDEEILIAPMLLIPFVENAFKHGAHVNGYLFIDIDVSLDEEEFVFEIRNSIKNNVTHYKKSGIGLENIKKRLEMDYPGRYSLEFTRKEGWFVVKMVIRELKDIHYAKKN